jgi:hypothetical protein
MFVYPAEAIAREKEIKGWRRSKKIALIEAMNPHWHDLAAKWQDVYKPVNRVPADPREIRREEVTLSIRWKHSAFQTGIILNPALAG